VWRIALLAAILGDVAAGAALGRWIDTPAGQAAGHGATHHAARHVPSATLPSTTVQPAAASTVPSVPAPCIPTTVPGGAYAIGDSVMLDAQQSLQGCVPNIQVNGVVSRQWSDGETIARQVIATPSPPSVVVIDLGTNGPVTDTDFETMMSILHGASRVVFVTVHVDRPWQDTVNGVLARGVSRHPTAVLADWEGLAVEHPEWFYSDGTHLPIGGPGAQALAGLIASKL
jgi:hypothetical protein